MEFRDEITSLEALRALIPPARGRAAQKVARRIDPVTARFIAASPFVVVATRGRDGRLDVSPKGDPAGFVQVLDPTTLAIPDRPGNNRLDSFENLLVHPEIGLIFLIPGHRDTLRVSGRARLVRDPELLASMAIGGRLPLLATVVDVEEVFVHCPKCAVRSGIWSSETWPERGTLPSIEDLLQAHGAMDGLAEGYPPSVNHDRLY